MRRLTAAFSLLLLAACEGGVSGAIRDITETGVATAVKHDEVYCRNFSKEDRLRGREIYNRQADANPETQGMRRTIVCKGDEAE